MFNLPFQLFRKEVFSDTKINQIYIYLDNRTLPKKVLPLFTQFSKMKKKKKEWCCFETKKEERGKNEEEEEEENEKRRIDCLSTWKVDLYFRRRRRKRDIFLTLLSPPLSTPMHVVWCVREDFPSRRYCNMCAPSFVLFLWQSPASAGNENTKIWNAEPRVQFMNHGITTRCVSACCGYIVFV